MEEAVIVSAVRTAVGRSGKGVFATTRPEELATVAVHGALARVPALEPTMLGDVVFGCALPEGEQGWNIARYIALRAGLPVEISAMTVNRLCASGLEAIAQAAMRVQTGAARAVLAGGVESMSMIPMSGNKPSPNPWLAEHYPAALLTMGLTAERVARRYNVSREDQDAFAMESHRRALAAQAENRFTEEIVPVTVERITLADHSVKTEVQQTTVSADEGPRADTSLETLAKLKPAFQSNGSVTAGNSSQTSDGAAATVVVSKSFAKELGLRPLARFVGYSTAGCLPEEMGAGPIYAIPKVLLQSGIHLEEIARIELNEAFAAQSLAVIRELGMDPARVNVNGGAIALGHPLGCTGSKLTATLLSELRRSGSRYGMVTMCVGGGMGAAAIFENLT
jgi:acetyl-CoA acyltransferase